MPIFKTKAYVSNVRKEERMLVAITIGGQRISRHVVDTKFFGQVWYNDTFITNILSLANVVKYARVTMDSSNKNSIFVHREDGMVMEFKQYKFGIYYVDVTEQGKQSNTSSDINYNYYPSFSLIQTIEDNKSKYTKRKVRNAERARALMRKLGSPSQHDFEHYLKEKFIRNCSLTVLDVKRTVKTFGPEVYSLT